MRRKQTYPPEYLCWMAMKARCNNPKHESYPMYGAKGIKVCPEWEQSFKAFLAAVGPRPTLKHSLDRKIGTLGYFPGNVRWATSKEQGRNKVDNRLITWSGKTQPLVAWAEEMGLPFNVLQYRLNANWEVGKALQTPVQRGLVIEHDGTKMGVTAWAKRVGLPPLTIYKRIKRGWSASKALGLEAA